MNARQFLLTIAGVILLVGGAEAKTSWRVTPSFESTQFLLHRGDHAINDYETAEAEIQFLFENEKNFKLDLKPRIKADFLDSSRNRYLPNEAFFLLYGRSLEFSAGWQMKSWGVSNSTNPTDILNRYDFEDNYYHPDKLGDLMAGFKIKTDGVGIFSDPSLEVIILPFFQKSPLPENDTRFALQRSVGGVPFSLTDHQDSPSYPQAVGTAVTLSTTLRPVDIFLHYYHGPEKNPGFRFDIDSTGALRLEPFTYTIDMIGLNIEAPVAGNLLIHLESAWKMTKDNAPRPHDIAFGDNNAIPESYLQIVPGVDYTFSRFLGENELVLAVEYLGDSQSQSSLRNFRPFQNDLFAGFRLNWMDSRETRLEAGAIKDLENGEVVFLADFSTKIYKELKAELEGALVKRDSGVTTPLSFFDNNSYILTRLSYSFGGTFGRKNASTPEK